MSPFNDSSLELLFTLLTNSERSEEESLNMTELSSDDAPASYCNTSGWREFTASYRQWHGHISILVCVFGCLANLLNLIVLTRKGMISPTNAILTGLALADLLNMIEYIPYAFFMYIWRIPYTYAFALFILVHANFAQVSDVSISFLYKSHFPTNNFHLEGRKYVPYQN